MESKHSPLPWHLEDKFPHVVSDAMDELICRTDHCSSNGEFIVKCVNSQPAYAALHEAAVKALDAWNKAHIGEAAREMLVLKAAIEAARGVK